MRIDVQAGLLLLGLFLAMIVLVSCVSNGAGTRPPSVPSGVWEKYSQGDFTGAKAGSDLLLEDTGTADAGRYMLALISHVTGKHREAIAHHSMIRNTYTPKKRINELLTYSYIHLGDINGALSFLERHGFAGDTALRKSLELYRERPLFTIISDVAELPFADDALTPYMPGIAARINGIDTVARLDTGGTYIHLSAALAKRLGIAPFASEKTFAGLKADSVGLGIADLELGSVKLRNVPVLIHEKALTVAALADAFAVEMGPIIGTNVLEQFLTTIDGPGGRLILSPRNDAETAKKHLALLPGHAHTVPFALTADHFMIMRTAVAQQRPVNMFVDSGLVVVNQEQGQASLLTSASVLESWGASIPGGGDRFAEIPDGLRIDDIHVEEITSYAVEPAVWKRFGTWAGLNVEALLSWGFLKKYCWTIDFDTYRFTFRESKEPPFVRP